MLERILGSASKRDKAEKEQKRAKLAQLFENINTSQAEVLAELELLRKDDVKVSCRSHIHCFMYRSLYTCGAVTSLITGPPCWGYT